MARRSAAASSSPRPPPPRPIAPASRRAHRGRSAAGDGREALLIDGDLAAGAASEQPGPARIAARRPLDRRSRLSRGRGAVPAARAAPAIPFDGAGAPRRRRVPAAPPAAQLRSRRARRAADERQPAHCRRSPPQADVVLLVAALGEPQAALAREAESALASGARIDAVALIDLPTAERCAAPSPALKTAITSPAPSCCWRFRAAVVASRLQLRRPHRQPAHQDPSLHLFHFRRAGSGAPCKAASPFGFVRRQASRAARRRAGCSPSPSCSSLMTVVRAGPGHGGLRRHLRRPRRLRPAARRFQRSAIWSRCGWRCMS